MELQHFRKRFFQDLTGSYPQQEIQSFFNLLCEHFLGISRLEIALSPHLSVEDPAKTQLEDALQQLLKHQPLQYILGETEFYGRTFSLNEHTLIPRPETEELVTWIIEDAKQAGRHQQSMQILDMGTGSGCIAISLAKELPQAEVSALDISTEALLCAQENAQRHEAVVSFSSKDMLQLAALPGMYDIMVSNPPYVRESEKQQMHPNVLNYEPATALYVSDDDPLVFYRKIGALAQQYLQADGALYLEINEYLSKELEELLQQLGFDRIEIRQDIFGKDRMIKASRTRR